MAAVNARWFSYEFLQVSKGNSNLSVSESLSFEPQDTVSGQDRHVGNVDEAKPDYNNEAHLLHTKIVSLHHHYLVRMQTGDWRVTLAGARCSDLLEVNEEGTKVKRREWLVDAPSCELLLAWKLCRDGTGGEKDVAARGPVVEFESLEGARRAYSRPTLRPEVHLSGRGMCVVPLGGREIQGLNSNQEEASPPSISEFKNRPSGQRHDAGGCTQGPVRIPWVQRRNVVANTALAGAAGLHNRFSRILRDPLGPDGTKGFRGRGRGRPRLQR